MQNEKPTSANRSHKDSLFVDYFSKDRDWKQHFLSLYNALHGTSLQVADTVLERVNLEQVLYKSYYNDIAVLVDGQFILMIEHQSTINPNMPLRLLEYIARIYGNIVDSKAKFSRHLVPLARPEFIVFYTGDQKLPQKATCTCRMPSRSKIQVTKLHFRGSWGQAAPKRCWGKGRF